MRTNTILGAGIAMFLGAVLAVSTARTTAHQPSTGIAIDSDDLGGIVTGPNGPEAGVRVIGETTDLPTKFARIVVTNDRGRYLVPDLPKANYRCESAATAWSIRRKCRLRPADRSI